MPDPDLQARVASIPWFHSIDLGGITTPGRKSPVQLVHEFQRPRLPGRSAGFRDVRIVVGPPSWPRWLAHTARSRLRHENPGNPHIGVPVRGYRAVLHAFK